MKKRVSIIIPTYNRKDYLKVCLESIFKQNYPKSQYEIIIIDDGSTDGTRDLVKQFKFKNNLRYFYQKNQGPAAARNLGIKKSRGALIAFTDADCFPDKNWLESLIKRYKAEDESIGAIGGSLPNSEPKNILEKYLSLMNKNKQSHQNDPRPYFLTANILFPRKILEKVGYFDEHLFSGEDADICWRISEAGYRLVYEPNAVVFFKNRETISKLMGQCFRDGRGWARLEKKYNIGDVKSRKITFDNFKILVNLDKKFKDKRTSNISIIRRIIYYFITELFIFLGLIYEHYLVKNENLFN